MEFLTRDVLLNGASQLPREEAVIPELNGKLLVRGLSAYERDEYEASCLIGEGKKQRLNAKGMRTKLFIRCVITPDGKPVFSDADAVAINNMPAAVVDRVFEVASRLSGMSERDVEELEKNSAGARRGAPSSD